MGLSGGQEQERDFFESVLPFELRESVTMCVHCSEKHYSKNCLK